MIPNDVEILKEVRSHRYATPYFFTSRKILEHNYKTFSNMFKDVEVYYALKANSDPKILTFLNKIGCRFAADSHEELDKIAKHAPSSRVLIRARVNDSGSVFTFSERFGAPIESIK